MMVVRIAVGERTFKTLERLYPDEMDRDDSRPANPAWRACLAEIGVFTGQEGVPVLSINYLHLLQNFFLPLIVTKIRAQPRPWARRS